MQKSSSTQKPMQKSSAMPKTSTSTGKSSSGKPCCEGKNMNTEFAQDMVKLTDAEIISDVLGGQKALIKLYGTALCESSCEKMRKLIESEMTECACDQYDAFLFMNQRGLYPTENVDNAKMSKTKQKFNDANTKLCD